MVEYNSDVGHDTGGAMVGETQGSVRWGIECRFEFIEFRLFWKGHVNRGDLMPVSGISINQASADLNPTPAWHRRPCSMATAPQTVSFESNKPSSCTSFR